jgi:glucarate dehydratase
MTCIASAHVTFVDVPIRKPLRNSRGVLSSARRGIVELATDDGLTGFGEFSSRVSPDVARAVMPTLVGLSAFDVSKLRLRVGGGKFPDQAAAILLAGIEMAFLDLQGKAIGRPVHDLLGGAMRPEIPLIGYVFRHPHLQAHGQAARPEQPMHELVADVVEEFGFGTVKLKAGAVDPDADVSDAEAVRERFPDLALRIDPSGSWPVPTTLKLLPRLAALDLEWLEDPVMTAFAMHEVRARTSIPLATNMCVTSPWDLPPAVTRVPVDVVLLDLWFLGGLHGSVEFQRALDAFRFGIGIHAGGGSPALGIGQAAALHLAAALPQLPFAADSFYHHLCDDILAEAHHITGGCLPVPAGPGLGVDVDRDQLERYRIRDV